MMNNIGRIILQSAVQNAYQVSKRIRSNGAWFLTLMLSGLKD